MELKGFIVEINSKYLKYTVKLKGHSKEKSKCIRVKEYQIEDQVN